MRYLIFAKTTLIFLLMSFQAFSADAPKEKIAFGYAAISPTTAEFRWPRRSVPSIKTACMPNCSHQFRHDRNSSAGGRQC